MDALTHIAWLWLIPTLYLVCFSGLTYIFLLALREGVESYDRVYSEQTARQFADIFFFIPRGASGTWPGPPPLPIPPGFPGLPVPP